MVRGRGFNPAFAKLLWPLVCVYYFVSSASAVLFGRFCTTVPSVPVP